MTTPSIPARGLRALTIVAALGLAACTSSAGGSPGASLAAPASQNAAASAAAASAAPTPSAEPSAVASSAPSPSAVPSTAEATGVANSIDPCALVTPEEASKLAGATFAAGQETSDPDGAKICSYGQEGVVFEVITSVAPDLATAKKNEDKAKAELEANAPGFPYKLTELPGFAPGADAAVVSGSASAAGMTYSGIAIYVLKGTTFFGLSDIATGGKAPSSSQMQDQAKVTLGRLP